MNPKNAIKMINIQKSNWTILSSLAHSVLFGPLWFYIVPFGPIQSIRSTLILFSPLQSYSVHIDPIQSIMSTLVHFSPILAIQSMLFTLMLFDLHWSYSVHSIHFSPIQLILVLFSPLRSIMSTFVLICPFVLIQSTLVHLVPIRSYSVHSVHFILTGPIRSICIHFSPIRFTFDPFLFTYIQRKYIFWLKAPILNLILLTNIQISNS